MHVIAQLYYSKSVEVKGNQVNFMLQTQVLSVGQVNEPCIRLIQENLIENSIQKHLSYILNYNGP